MSIGIEREEREGEEKEKGKRGRKKISDQEVKNLETSNESLDKRKFFVDVSKDLETKDLIAKLLADANNKTFGREIILKDLVIVALPKLTPKDIERVQENALTDMEKLERLLLEHNEKNKTNLSLAEFLVKKLNI